MSQFFPLTIIGVGVVVGASATYIWYAYMEYKWPFRRKGRQGPWEF